MAALLSHPVRHPEDADHLPDLVEPDHQRVARSAVSNMFEDERILGPFSEAVDVLADERLTLYAMSVLAPGLNVHNDYAMRHLAGAVGTGDGIIARALAHGAGSVPSKTGLVQEQVTAHLHELRGWAKISATLPPAVPPARDEFRPGRECVLVTVVGRRKLAVGIAGL